MKNMRRVIAAFTAAAFMASTMALSVHAESVLLGDANGDRYDIAVTPISVTVENDYFECVDDYIHAKKDGYYFIVSDYGTYFAGYVQPEEISGETLKAVIDRMLTDHSNSLDTLVGSGLTYAYGEDNEYLVYSADGVNVDVCYHLDRYDEPIYNLYMRYWRDDEENAAVGNVEAKYDIQLKIDTEHYVLGSEYQENFQTNPPERAIISEVSIGGDESNYRIDGLDEESSIDDIVVTFYKNGFYRFRAYTSNGRYLEYDFLVDTIVPAEGSYEEVFMSAVQITANTENEYFDLAENGEELIAKKDGYYIVVFEGQASYYTPLKYFEISDDSVESLIDRLLSSTDYLYYLQSKIGEVCADSFDDNMYLLYSPDGEMIEVCYQIDSSASETTTTETTTTTESTTTETTTTETTTTTESTTTETTTTETTTTTESTTTETTTTETTTSESAATETSTTETAPSETTEVSVGDLNNDTAVDASDAAVILVAAAAVGAGDDSGLTEEQKKAADVNNDGEFDAVDAAIVLQYAAAAGAGYTGSMEEFLADIKKENPEE